MGKVGWIPVDATAFEINYLDSGHIRLGVYQFATTFNPKKMEILDYKAGLMRCKTDSECRGMRSSKLFNKNP